ncbi:carbohydrate ABC transporter permease [Kitasatospora sp. NPDC058201]|uniref:carbohydrate ABC transporter permease n=1 Tax=unclassified Kitasatospora TaxID=2633591 RepID=UPI0036534536
MKRTSFSPLRRLGDGTVWFAVGLNLLLLVWIFTTAIRNTRDIFARPFGLPTDINLRNFVKAWEGGGFGQAALSSVYVSVVSAFLAVAIAAPAAYMLARRRTRTSGAITMSFVMGLGVPGQVLMVPLFVGLAQIQLTDSFTGLILVYVGLAMPFTVYLLTGFFAGVPKVLEEAAAIDGATGLRCFVRIVLPVARGGLTTAFLLNFIHGWNETLFAIVLMHSEDKVTLPVALANFVASQQLSGLDWGTMFAGIAIILAPLVALFTWMGNRIVQGMTVGIDK